MLLFVVSAIVAFYAKPKNVSHYYPTRMLGGEKSVPGCDIRHGFRMRLPSNDASSTFLVNFEHVAAIFPGSSGVVFFLDLMFRVSGASFPALLGPCLVTLPVLRLADAFKSPNSLTLICGLKGVTHDAPLGGLESLALCGFAQIGRNADGGTPGATNWLKGMAWFDGLYYSRGLYVCGPLRNSPQSSVIHQL